MYCTQLYVKTEVKTKRECLVSTNLNRLHNLADRTHARTGPECLVDATLVVSHTDSHKKAHADNSYSCIVSLYRILVSYPFCTNTCFDRIVLLDISILIGYIICTTFLEYD